MPCYIRYLLSAVHTTWSGFKLCGGGWDVGWKWRGGKHENWEWGEGRVRPGPVMWSLSLSELLSAGRLGCIQFNFIFHYLGIYRHINTRLFRDKMTHLSLLSSPHQGEAQLPCLSGNIFMGCTLHFTGSTITGTGSLAKAQQSLILIFQTPMTRRWALSYLTLACFLTLTCQVAIL